jgi:acyl carrier protein
MFLTGICDLKTVTLNKTLSELGLHSMTVVEIKQTLEQEFELSDPAGDLQPYICKSKQTLEQEFELSDPAGDL